MPDSKDDRWVLIKDPTLRDIIRDLVLRMDSLDVSGTGFKISAGSVGANELAVGAVLASLGYVPIDRAGGSFTGVVTFGKGINLPYVVNTSNSLTVDDTHYAIESNPTVAGAVTFTLPPAPAIGRELVFRDGKGDAATNNITIGGNGKNIDGAATKVMNVNGQSFRIQYNGTIWRSL